MPFAPMSKKQQEEQGQQGGINISGQAANFATGVPGQESEKGAKSSGQYANLQSYLDANQTQGAEMGGKVASGVESKGADAQGRVDAFSTQKPNVAAYDPNSAIQKAGSLSDEEKAQYQSVKANGGYSGPNSVDQAGGFNDAQAAATKAAQAAKSAGTEIGQQQLLKETYARPDYSQGQNNLDQVLMKGSEAGRQKLQDASSKYSDLENVFNTKANEVGTSINAAKSQALANRQAFNPAEQAAWKGLIDPIQARADQMNQQNPAAYQGVLSDVSDDELTADTLQRLGLGAGQQLWDTELSSYLTPNQTQLGLNDAANADERGRYSALAGLFQDQTRSQIGEKGLGTNALNFDKTKFDADVAAKGAAYGKAYENDRVFPGNATAKEMEEVYIPRAQNYVNTATSAFQRNQWQTALDTALKQVQDFKNQYQNTRTIKAGV